MWDTKATFPHWIQTPSPPEILSYFSFFTFFLVLFSKWVKNLLFFSLLVLRVNEGLWMWCLMRRQALVLSSFPSVGWECHGLRWGNEKCVSIVTATTLPCWRWACCDSVTATPALGRAIALLHPLFCFDWKSYIGHDGKMGISVQRILKFRSLKNWYLRGGLGQI